jgi:hypothetical protein
MSGYLYCMTNPYIQDLCKIGYTTNDPSLRAKSLSNTSVPDKFIVHYSLYIDNACKHEPILFDILISNGFKREKDNKEFFRCTPDDIKKFFSIDIITEYKKANNIIIIDKNIVKPIKPSGDYICEFCDLVFENRINLLAHQRRNKFCIKIQKEVEEYEKNKRLEIREKIQKEEEEKIQKRTCSGCDTLFSSVLNCTNHKNLCLPYQKLIIKEEYEKKLQEKQIQYKNTIEDYKNTIEDYKKMLKDTRKMLKDKDDQIIKLLCS